MIDKMIAIYCICDDCLKALNIKDDPQVKISSAEVVATAIIAAKLFGGCFWRAQVFLRRHGYIPKMLSCSRFNRRIHALNIEVFALIISLISQVFKTRNRSPSMEWADSLCTKASSEANGNSHQPHSPSFT